MKNILKKVLMNLPFTRVQKFIFNLWKKKLNYKIYCENDLFTYWKQFDESMRNDHKVGISIKFN